MVNAEAKHRNTDGHIMIFTSTAFIHHLFFNPIWKIMLFMYKISEADSAEFNSIRFLWYNINNSIMIWYLNNILATLQCH